MTDLQPSRAAPAISVEGVSKAYGATVALDDVSFAIEAGRVHALLGENGAGKSTLVKMLSGLVEPDAGAFRVFGAPARLDGARAAHALGLQTAFQELTLVRDLTVVENMLLPYAPRGLLGLLRRGEGRRRVVDHFEALGLEADLDAEVRDLELGLKQKVEIARALFRRPRILLLDEPTSSLSARDVDWLGALVERQRAAGVTVVFISHRMREVRAFCDSLTVLRNGRHIATGAARDFTDEQVIREIVGRSLAQTFPPKPAADRPRPAPVLAVDRLATDGKLADASFSLAPGEIVGVAGLQGMGQLDLFLACFGMARATAGTIAVDGRAVALASPHEAVKARIGIALLPEERKTEALFLRLPGKHNASLPVIDRFTRFGLIDAEAETRAVAAAFARVEAPERALWLSAGSFSGGNQQKIAIAKWLLAEARVLLLYDPTRGIDVGTKHELYLLMRAYAEAGGAILFHSTEIPELVHMCDRVHVVYQGRFTETLSGPEVAEEAIVRAALGGAAGARAA